VVIEPLDVWPSEFLACIGAWPEEIPRPKQSASAKGRDPFA
jgi:hypothetical protein